MAPKGVIHQTFLHFSSLEESSRDLASKFSHNLNDSGKSTVSRNSWVGGGGSESGSKKSSGKSNGKGDEKNGESSAERRHRLRARAEIQLCRRFYTQYDQ